jgi:hypothetical protein
LYLPTALKTFILRLQGEKKIAKHIDNFTFFFFPHRHVGTIKSRQSQRNSKLKQRITNIFPVRRTLSLKKCYSYSYLKMLQLLIFNYQINKKNLAGAPAMLAIPSFRP